MVMFNMLSGTGDSQRDSRKSIRANHSQLIETPIFIARQADSHESLEFPIRANHPIRANRANRFARITPLSQHGFLWGLSCWELRHRKNIHPPLPLPDTLPAPRTPPPFTSFHTLPPFSIKPSAPSRHLVLLLPETETDRNQAMCTFAFCLHFNLGDNSQQCQEHSRYMSVCERPYKQHALNKLSVFHTLRSILALHGTLICFDRPAELGDASKLVKLCCTPRGFRDEVKRELPKETALIPFSLLFGVSLVLSSCDFPCFGWLRMSGRRMSGTSRPSLGAQVLAVLSFIS